MCILDHTHIKAAVGKMYISMRSLPQVLFCNLVSLLQNDVSNMHWNRMPSEQKARNPTWCSRVVLSIDAHFIAFIISLSFLNLLCSAGGCWWSWETHFHKQQVPTVNQSRVIGRRLPLRPMLKCPYGAFFLMTPKECCFPSASQKVLSSHFMKK